LALLDVNQVEQDFGERVGRVHAAKRVPTSVPTSASPISTDFADHHHRVGGGVVVD
jgi:hypothetical protein